MKCFQEAVTNRRTNYALGKEIKVLPSQIIAAVEKMTHEVPSSFNMQSARVVVAMGEHHEKIWHITKETLRKIVPAEKFAPTEAKLDGFAAAYGTVLFFDEIKTIDNFGQNKKEDAKKDTDTSDIQQNVSFVIEVDYSRFNQN